MLTATDVAGNVTEQTVEFSVKIDATVAFKPNSVNVKSGGQSVATFTEFPPGYDVAQIDVDTTEVVFKNWMIQAESAPGVHARVLSGRRIPALMPADRPA